jgi:outer membrane protein
MTKNTLLHLIALAILAAVAPAHAKEGDVVVRARAAHVSPETDSRLSSAVGGHLTVDANTIPEIDFSYYFTDHVAAELILATGTRHHVINKGNLGDLGSVNLLPPTLTVQWHFNPDQAIDPYVGLGINYTRFMDNSLRGGAIHTERDSFGPAIQFGADYNLEGGWLLNLDVKKIWIQTDVRHTTLGKIDSLDIDPWVVSVGFGKKF